MTAMVADNWWSLELEGMPGFEMAMKRIYAWYERGIIDRPPVRFVAHNAFIEQANQAYPSHDIKDRWFDAEFQVDTFLQSEDFGLRWEDGVVITKGGVEAFSSKRKEIIEL